MSNSAISIMGANDTPGLAYATFEPHGYICLENVAGSIPREPQFLGTDADLTIVNAARTSFDTQSVVLTDRDKGLINFLLRERHGSPFEQVEVWMRVRAPIFVVREWVRHRIAEINEESGRYSQLKPEFWVPADEAVRRKVQGSKPGAYQYETIPDEILRQDVIEEMEAIGHECFDSYHRLLDKGVAMEVARTVLPVSTYSTFVWKANLRSMMNFLSLRNQEQAQREIREYAETMEHMISPYVSAAFNAFNENGRVAP